MSHMILPNLPALLGAVTEVRLAVFGDFCLDAYWRVDAEPPPTSLETGLPVRCVRSQRYTLGGAGNVAANLIDLGVRRVSVVGVVGQDLFGETLRRLLVERGADVAGLLEAGDDWQTPVYIKPYVDGAETHRLDFGMFNVLDDETEHALRDALDAAARQADVVIINQQLTNGVCPPGFITELNHLIATYPQTTFIVDSRDHADRFTNAVLKLNAKEANRIAGESEPGDRISASRACACARALSRRTGRPVFLTRGVEGIVVADQEQTHCVPGIQVIEQTDPVGAGDTATASLGASLGAGCDPLAAATLANIAASVTVRKLQTTGTATPAEICAAGEAPDYVYLPELAADPRRARYLDGTEIEHVENLPAPLSIQHVIFDHDGTLSALREGWEQIMQPMMVRAVLGPRFDAADPGLYEKVTEAVQDFIDKTTGIQTLVQMQGLVELVRRFGCVPEEQVLDDHGYKQIYNEALLRMVKGRIVKLQRGELDPTDFQLKNADKLLGALHERGIKLYLASGTDEQDVIAEAEAMGYAHLFEGRIFGAVGDVNVEAKKLVLERIIREHNLGGHELATFGDGPVEMRETRKRGGVCVGVASDEVRRFGLNPAKRSRLIRAGAMLIVPDYSQLESVLRVLELD